MEDIERIASLAFNYSSRKFKNLYIPKNVRFIEKHTFASCEDNIESIVVDKDNPIFDSRDNCNSIILTKENLMIAQSKKTVIPDGVTVSLDFRQRFHADDDRPTVSGMVYIRSEKNGNGHDLSSPFGLSDDGLPF